MESNFKLGKWTKKKPLPAQNTKSEAMSKDLLKRAFPLRPPDICDAFYAVRGSGEW
jgi:3-methyladenine DNA glycosylase Tag